MILLIYTNLRFKIKGEERLTDSNHGRFINLGKKNCQSMPHFNSLPNQKIHIISRIFFFLLSSYFFLSLHCFLVQMLSFDNKSQKYKILLESH